MMGFDFPPADPRSAVIAMAGLSVAFALKHYVADFVLQTNWIARGKERATGWLAPLAAHAAVHAILSAALIFALAPRLWWLAPIDFGVHFAVDRAKTGCSHRGGWKPDQAPFWWLLGFDQFIHQVTNIALAAAIVLL